MMERKWDGKENAVAIGNDDGVAAHIQMGERILGKELSEEIGRFENGGNILGTDDFGRDREKMNAKMASWEGERQSQMAKRN
jgi:hypothetical protein